MKVLLLKGDMELIEKALRHEVEMLQMLNHDGLLWYDLLNVNSLLDRWLDLKQVDGYKNVHELN